jgi:hypothetical protein
LHVLRQGRRSDVLTERDHRSLRIADIFEEQYRIELLKLFLVDLELRKLKGRE